MEKGTLLKVLKIVNNYSLLEIHFKSLGYVPSLLQVTTQDPRFYHLPHLAPGHDLSPLNIFKFVAREITIL
jgi:hypothetical protein